MTKFRDWFAYQKAFELSTLIFDTSRHFPKEEIYSLTNQIIRSSRSVCSNLAEAYGKRKYPSHFILKLSDAQAENNETQCWLDFAIEHRFMLSEQYNILNQKNEEVGKLIGYMIRNPHKFMHQGN